MTVWPEPFSSEGTFVSVIPLEKDHLDDLTEAVIDGDLNRLWYTMIPDASGMEDEIERRLQLQKQGSMLPFSVIENTSGKVIGMTTYMNIDAANRRLEIGSTWYRKSAQRTPLNTECKYILLTHAFENLNCIAVEFRTHYINQQSRRAIERLGAKFDGLLRSHIIMANGTVRDTCQFAPQWSHSVCT